MAPLFETLDDLTNAPGTMTTLLSNAWYLKHINGMQECMIGETCCGGALPSNGMQECMIGEGPLHDW